MLILTAAGFLRPFGGKRLALLAERQIQPNGIQPNGNFKSNHLEKNNHMKQKTTSNKPTEHTPSLFHTGGELGQNSQQQDYTNTPPVREGKGVGKKPRGIRNNNPLNIRRSRARWQGMSLNPTDREFCQFMQMKWGWRAAFKLLCETYYVKWGLKTLEAIINKWAPPSDGNNTQSYINSVCQNVAWKRDEPLPAPTENPALWRRIGWAMGKVENGNYFMDYDEMQQGFALWFNELKNVK